MKIRVGTRGSLLATTQTAQTMATLVAAHPDLEIETVLIRTTGDVRQDVPLAQVGGDGLFVKELERALTDGRIDVAVHSLKDLPTAQPEGLELAAILPREDARDAFISVSGTLLGQLPEGARIGTGSSRRQAQLAVLGRSWQLQGLRGNVDTRLTRLQEGAFDAILLACAGLDRLDRGAVITERISFLRMLPAPGQGAVVIQCRSEDAALRARLAAVDDEATRAAVTAERALLACLHGGCSIPLGALGRVRDDRMELEAFLGLPDGSDHVRLSWTGPLAKPVALGEALADRLLEAGGKAILGRLGR
ncbi:MAG: hydroxymethylbilane synthase [Candidatus Sericytochromatia bacterium]|nr:hydroxymethylbilane synthase [Candidatus Sericytochromatia bacterium]